MGETTQETPSPAEIAERSAEVRAGWTEAERLRRTCYPPVAVETRAIETRTVRDGASGPAA